MNYGKVQRKVELKGVVQTRLSVVMDHVEDSDGPGSEALAKHVVGAFEWLSREVTVVE